MAEREENHKVKRRQSICVHFTTARYFNLCKIKPLKVFKCCTPGAISRVVEIQIIQELHSELMQKMGDKSTTEGEAEVDTSLLTAEKEGPQQSILNELMPFRVSFACLDIQTNSAVLLTINGKVIDVLKATGLDSSPIAVYEDVLKSLFHVITEKHMNCYTYHKRSKQLLRKSNYKFTLNAL